MSVKIDAIYCGELRCTATHAPSANQLQTDAPVDNGGKGETFSPTDLVATALGTCMLTVMGLVAQRNAIDITGTTAEVVKEMTADPVRRIGELRVKLTLPKDKPFRAADVAKLKAIADICPVKQSLHPDTKVTIEFILPSDASELEEAGEVSGR